ncbi:hypothetical protein D3C80_2110170 [compost metagenome]
MNIALVNRNTSAVTGSRVGAGIGSIDMADEIPVTVRRRPLAALLQCVGISAADNCLLTILGLVAVCQRERAIR